MGQPLKEAVARLERQYAAEAAPLSDPEGAAAEVEPVPLERRQLGFVVARIARPSGAQGPVVDHQAQLGVAAF